MARLRPTYLFQCTFRRGNCTQLGAVSGERLLGAPHTVGGATLSLGKVDVFWHEDVAVDFEVMPVAEGFQPGFEGGVGGGCVQVGEAWMAAEGDEVEVAFLLEVFGGRGACGSVTVGMGGSGSHFRAIAHSPAMKLRVNGAPVVVRIMRGPPAPLSILATLLWAI